MNVRGLRFLPLKGFGRLVEALTRRCIVYGTVKKDGFPAFGEISGPEELHLSQNPTHLSAKEFLFPQRETLLRFDLEKDTCEPVINSHEQAIVGLHSCDIHAIALMDKVFAFGSPDANYLARRQKTILIGTDCMPDEHCFCSSVNTMDVAEGFDLFLHTVRKGYLVRVGSSKGGALLKGLRTRPPRDEEIREYERTRLERLHSFKTRLDASWKLLPAIYAKSGGSHVWDRIGAICYGCGSCNNVCPTCYCFDVRDEATADLKKVERVRAWDGCTLEDFAKVSGGHNFRRSRADRLKHRFNRKFNYLSERFGALFCVGCGRCSRTCLVKINIAETTNELIHEGAKK